jgi:negative regulator of flagellin synthesis FlgM
VKIDKPSNSLAAGKTAEGSAAKVKVNSAPAATPSSDTNVSLGSTAAQLRSMEQTIAAVPVTNAAKVTEIKQAISEGRFKVNPEVVASRLLDTVRELIGGKVK